MSKTFKLPYLAELAGTFLLPVVIVLLCLPLRDWISPTDVAMLQLLWVAWQAQHYGWRWAAMTTLVSVLLVNWCFVPPYYTFDVHDASFFISFVVMLVLGLLISLLSERSRQQLRRLRNAMSQSRGMYMLAKGLGQRQSWPEQCAYAAKLLSRRLGAAIHIVPLKPQTIDAGFSFLPVGLPAIAWIQTPIDKTASHFTLLQAAQSLLAQSHAGLQLTEKAKQDSIKAQLEQQKAMLLRSLSHDLRTPLATIMGASSMLADPDMPLTDSQRQQQAKNIYRQSQILNQHFEKVLELSKAQLSSHTLVRCEFSSDDLIAGALARRGEEAAELSKHLHTTPACQLCGDMDLLEIALANMLENALRHGEPPFELSFKVHNGQYLMQLTNGSKTHSTAAGGHGLGLNICVAVAALHQGQFKLSSHSTADKLTAPFFTSGLFTPELFTADLFTAELEWPV